MDLSLYSVDTVERRLLVGLTSAQRLRLNDIQGEEVDLRAHLDEVGYLAVWECRPALDGRVELIEPVVLFADAVVALRAMPCSAISARS